MFNIGWTELLIILFLVLLFFGPKRLPELAEALGKSIARFKKASQDMRNEIESQPRQTPSAPSVPDEKKLQG
jgi:TatA/E family protein of Tat protein translocase